ncbi:hypothetical protein L596_029593 [Steinernema carpocapsae]|uniref:FLYWCH-type domain-containing protein n=1 Tax=Steinernema carpocapsae TaxID=34508 RepID=A0A4V5ZXJ3_STECR|nr:hypothetical protein L596_029593 [Steinernema carpocapsae]
MTDFSARSLVDRIERSSHSPYSTHGLTAGDLSPIFSDYGSSSDSDSISDKDDIHPGPRATSNTAEQVFLQTTRGNPLVAVSGFQFVQHGKPRKDGSQLWRCAKEKEEKCKARAVCEPRIFYSSIHSSRAHTRRRQHCYHGSKASIDMKKAVVDEPKKAPKKLIKQARKGVLDEVVLRLPKIENARRMIARMREIPGRGAVDVKNFYDVEFTEYFSSLGKHGSDRFLLWDSRDDPEVPDGQGIFLFATDDGLSSLKSTTCGLWMTSDQWRRPRRS